jgi:diguanylate cyclase (GGDEF)-like protein
MRRTPFVALLLGLVLLSAGVLTMASADAAQRQQDRGVQRDAAQVATAFTNYFERARSLDLLLAQSPAFHASGGSLVADNAAANHALSYLEQLYPGAIGEACYIDSRGYEIARVTRGTPAAVADLSTGEATNAFFAKTFALPAGEVYQAAPYVSVDTHEWVISNSTWIRPGDAGPMIVHFEVGLESFRTHLHSSTHGRHVAVVDRAAGRTILQDGLALPDTDPVGQFAPLPDVVRVGPGAVKSLTAAGHGAAVAAIPRSSYNANDWMIVEWSTTRASFIPLWAGAAGASAGVALIIFFLLVLRRQQSALRMATRLDHLTGMGNRKALEEALSDAVATAAQPDGHPAAVLMLDLDGFKQINDTLGHDKGDLVLQEIARRLHANTFEHDTAARLGGDEFAVVLRRLKTADDVAAVAYRLRDALIRPIVIDGVARFIGASFGAAVYGDHGGTPEELLRAADAAMYQAKRGRHGVRLYDPGTAEGANASTLAADLLIAIEDDRVMLAFQPEFSLATGRIVGVEALARWKHADQDVPPSEFIPLAEQTGLIRQLTHLTLRKALDEAQRWYASGLRLPVSVNLSALLVADRSLRSDVAGLLHERGLTGEALVLEITETSSIADPDAATDVLQSLRSMGVRIELDDFGSGYGSFKALHELPLDGVKIDRHLVTDLSTGGQRLLAATVDIAHRLELEVVAEGIEDEETLEAVRRLGCDTAQGYYLGRPMRPDALWRRLTTDATAAVPLTLDGGRS